MIVEDTPDAVRGGVEEMKRRKLSPDHIRSRTLGKIQRHRQTLIALVQRLYDREGIQQNFEAEWRQLFAHKFIFRRQKHASAIRRLTRAGC